MLIAAAAVSVPAARLRGIDVLRGIVMVLMAIDHVRVYAGVPAGGPDPAIFFTRWITHFCAPVFVFLAGTAIHLSPHVRRAPVRFLVTRGLWLVLLELTVLRLAWTFNLDVGGYALAGVIWMLGWCMVMMAGLVRLPTAVVGGLGVTVIALHNLVGPWLTQTVPPGDTMTGALSRILYVSFFAGPAMVTPAGPPLHVLYSLVPWIGVMAAGYGFGAVMAMEAGARARRSLAIGLGAIGLFVALRTFNLYGDPNDWTPAQPLSFLNTAKYPASLLYLLMTLGPAIALLPLLERWRGRVSGWLEVFGRVPLFYYVLHIPLIHALALGVSLVRSGRVEPWLFANHPMGNPPPPDGYMWSLPLLYAVVAIAVVVLHVACRWFADVKRRRHDWWLSYL